LRHYTKEQHTPGVATDADATITSAEWPEGLPGLWTGGIIKAAVELSPMEKLHAMFFITPGVPENPLLAYSKDDPDVIQYAVMQVNRGLQKRPDGSYMLLMVGRCRLSVSKPVLNARLVSALEPKM